MKLVVVSDVHLEAPFAWLKATPEVARQRRQALRDTLLNAIRLAEDALANAFLCGGDLYEHEYASPDTGEFLRSAFARFAPRPVFLAPGNHDWYGPASLYRQVEWPSNVQVFRTDRLEPVTLADGLTLWGAAHCAPANTANFLDGFRVDRGGIHLALFHASEQTWLAEQESGKVPHAPFEASQIVAAGLHHCFLGHYHRPRDAARHTYPGNPDPLTFGEDGERGAVIATVAPDGTVTRERRSVAVTEAHDLAVDLSGCFSRQDVRDHLAARLRPLRGIVRADLFGELGVDTELRLRDLHDVAPWLDALVLRDRGIRAAYDFAAVAAEPTVRGQFVRDVQEAAHLSDDEKRRILTIGLRALEGRNDLDVS